MKHCLNNAGLFDCFGDICVEHDGGYPWVTVFKEEKRSNQGFDQIDGNTIIVFCQLFDADYRDLSYIGYLLVQKNITCQHLLELIIDDMVGISDGNGCSIYLDNGQSCRDITGEQSTLKEVTVVSISAN